MNATTAQVLVFDSGVGGLSIAGHIRERLPAVSLNYLADTACFPYGMMNDEELVARVVELIGRADRFFNPDLIVIACNSASTLALPTLREKLRTPIVGVVPAIKPAVQISSTKVIGLLATPGTIRRDYTDDLIAQFAPGCEVIRVGSSALVQIVENLFQGESVSAEVFRDVVAPFVDAPEFERLDTVVLACTHFPLVKCELAQALPQATHWIDSGEAIARRVQQLLVDSINKAACPFNDQAFFTQHRGVAPDLVKRFKQFGFKGINAFDDSVTLVG